MRFAPRALLAATVLLFAAAPASAVQEWYDYYLQAKDDLAARRYGDCVKNVDRALQLRPTPGTNVRTYGVIFIDYLPHYYRGVCLLRQEKFDEALRAFSAADQGSAARAHEASDLVRLRSEAQSGIPYSAPSMAR